MSDSKTRFDAYEHAATLFSSYERFVEVKEIRRTMIDEGFIPSLSLRTRMASVAVLAAGAEEKDLFELLQDPLSDPDFTEAALYQLIRFLGDVMSFSPSTVDTIVQSWVKIHGQISGRRTLSYLIQIHVKRGQLEDAKAWLLQSVDEDATVSPEPFTDLIAGFTRRAHIDELAVTIANMKKAGVAPDLAVFNAIIFGHIKRRHFKDALATYNLLFSSRDQGLIPDNYTFTNMFTMSLKSLKPDFQVYSARRVPLPPPRELYSNLIECHLIQTGGRFPLHSKTLAPNVLNLALKLFLKKNDYEAAYNVIHTFHICQVPANATTVRIVLQFVLTRIQKERRKAAKKDSWIRTFLGPDWYDNAEANGTLSSLTPTDIFGRVWVAGTEPNSEPPCSPLDRYADWRDRRIANGVIDRVASADLRILRNIVRMMFFVGARSMVLDPLVPMTAVWARRVGQAQKEMVPDNRKMRAYLTSGKAGAKLEKIALGGGDKMRRHDLRYMWGG